MTPVEYQIRQNGAPDWTVFRTETDKLEHCGDKAEWSTRLDSVEDRIDRLEHRVP
jgi:hypothetical protein